MSLVPTTNIPNLLPLCQLTQGCVGMVRELGGTQSVNLRLRELGFCESARVTKISGRSTVVCDVCGTRLALSHDLARTILVQPLVAAG